MQTIRGIFTKRQFNPVSVGIRCVIPRSLFCMADASHVIAIDGAHALEANMLHGVRRVPLQEALQGMDVVAVRDYRVPDPNAGIAWGRTQIGAGYDFKGAAGLGLAPDRRWQDPSDWFCFEYFAGILLKAGRDMFIDNAHVTSTLLLSIKP